MTNPAFVLPDPIVTPEAYLLLENDNNTETRHEYVNGLVYAMTGTSRDHNRISGRLYVRLSQHLQGTRCEPFQSDMKVRIQRGSDVRFYYPDVQVACEEETDRYYNEQPCLIVEVLSDSTQRTDRTEKLMAYQTIDRLQEYVLLSQDSPYLEIYRRRSDWQRESFSEKQTVTLESIDLTLVVEELYL
ncbi:Uma2 family endonuclease [Methylobacter sp. Wu8]|uniref:Uma2 family endonuclease n=1 Tax=Methylobacter tundripaludum TaxID=173365 RepID=A0A2S6GGB0_9GAMM|nr:Uma2 family endonuclease [Methylobacter tundripaludum]PPK64257.1 Uma2 family endonuclease [Methylobacter tundripaludum]